MLEPVPGWLRKMPIDDLTKRYMDRLEFVALRCNDRLHKATYLFVALTVVLYFLGQSESAELDLLGVSVAVPRTLILLVSPVALSVLLYVVSSYSSLEAEAYKELRRLTVGLAGENERFADWQQRFFEPPTYYTYSELRNDAGTSTPFRLASRVADAMLFGGYLVVGPLIVGYFIYQSMLTLPAAPVVASAVVSVFLTVFACAQHFEKLRYRSPAK